MKFCKFSVCLFMLSFAVMSAGCGSNPDANNVNNVHQNKFNELESISIELAWSDEYDSSALTSFFRFLVPTVFAALPPDFQPHYQLNLSFDHNSKTILDTYKHFTGMDSSAMTTSTKVRESEVYNKISQYMKGIYLCEGTTALENQGWVGPVQPLIKITFAETTISNILFSGNPLAATDTIELCSRDFGEYLLSLMDDRRETVKGGTAIKI
ncbi:MAG: hypothetical protein Q3M30_09480 [Candidatus Electrothrix sp. Rat3]|nr:hypothetical protein [Candidatus Electrothrix rattekaaiensis]